MPIERESQQEGRDGCVSGKDTARRRMMGVHIRKIVGAIMSWSNR
jgi:hypothetical protein